MKIKSNNKHSNDLIHETSPYLLQHANNPVNWKPWKDKNLSEAKEENKLILISIGYSACHWCHVMEKESFEDSLVAKVMNQNYYNIKVDREERPDVDKVYMKAVQLMTGQGGWPLNVIALPDGRPIYGGTYFPKEQWLKILEELAKSFKEKPEEIYAFGDKLEQGIKSEDLVKVNTTTQTFEKSFVNHEVKKWSKYFDEQYGGLNKAPKFMMPNNYQFLLRYAHQNNDKKTLEYVSKTLTQMAYGGIFDQINGGFSRYSTDIKWHIPHFEKMLYDNAQLVSLYTSAYQLTNHDLYKEVVIETLSFIKEELTDEVGAFYSALDADSINENGELEEGAYYFWTKGELSSLLKEDFDLFSKYYNINDYGIWEDNKYVLIKSDDDDIFVKENNIKLTTLNELKEKWKSILSEVQRKREKPRLDDKALTSWNALMITAYLDAYTVFKDKEYLDLALKNATFIIEKQLKKDGSLFHTYKNNESKINGYLDDYASVISAFIKIYEVTAQEKWLTIANELVKYSIEYFFDDKTNLFFYTSKQDVALVTRTIEYQDNVIPSSNSIMAKNLFSLYHHLYITKYKTMATTMLNNVKPICVDNAMYFSNWLDIMANYTFPYYEVVVVGKKAKKMMSELRRHYLPQLLLSYSLKDSELPLIKNRYVDNETYIYVCIDNVCKLPVTTIEEALELISFN